MTDEEWKQFAKHFGAGIDVYHDWLGFEYVCTQDGKIWAMRYYDYALVTDASEVIDRGIRFKL